MNLDKTTGYFALDQFASRYDPIRTDRWKITFNFSEFTAYESTLGTDTSVFDSSAFSLLCQSYTPPSIEMFTEDIYYMGATKKVLPTAMNYETSTSITFLEDSNLTGLRNIMRWRDYCINVYAVSISSIDSESVDISAEDYYNVFGFGAPIYKNKDDEVFGNFFINKNVMKADIFDYTSGDSIFRIRYVNVFPYKVSHPSLSYDNPGLYEFTVDFAFSRVVYVIPTTVSSSTTTSYTSEKGYSWGKAS